MGCLKISEFSVLVRCRAYVLYIVKIVTEIVVHSAEPRHSSGTSCRCKIEILDKIQLKYNMRASRRRAAQPAPPTRSGHVTVPDDTALN